VRNVECLLITGEAANLPETARNPIRLLAEPFRDTKVKIGPRPSSVLAATVLDVSGFRSARDLVAWIKLMPKPHSSGGNERLGRKPVKRVAIARANKMARRVWALLRTGETYRAAPACTKTRAVAPTRRWGASERMAN